VGIALRHAKIAMAKEEPPRPADRRRTFSTTMPPCGVNLNKFLNRITSPKFGPLTYEEARDYYSLIGNLSANEKMNLPSMVKRDVDTMLAGLKTDVGNAADQVGRGADYYSAMNQYRQGAQLQDLKQGAKDAVVGPIVKGAAYGIGGTAAGGAAYKLWQWMTGK
jgi:hypothetical protein